MTRRNAASAPPRSRQSHHSHSHRSRIKEIPHTAEEKERGFEWTPGLALALVGAITWLDHTFDKTRRKSVGSHKQESHKAVSSDRSRDRSVRSPERSSSRGRSKKERERERERSKVRFDSGGDEIIDDSFYEYGPKRGRSSRR
ncbi:hypothetical protein B0J13DRAFT_540865 [Dactylonectria estremocensis]|uniref:Uncharacterized protein n=1 Tax=Dactylonectria estremocensis TaxID=1079267 RepID=A0A9P9FCB4_9HYPO|nr:hypothetical protein B0J13DRAFT_540865 [Dactylonectria estremocensis]